MQVTASLEQALGVPGHLKRGISSQQGQHLDASAFRSFPMQWSIISDD